MQILSNMRNSWSTVIHKVPCHYSWWANVFSASAPQAKRNSWATAVNCLSVAADVLVWYQSSRAEQSRAGKKSLHLSPGSVSQWATRHRTPGSQDSTVDPSILRLILFCSLLSFITITLFYSILFPETCRAIYRRVVFFLNQPVSICGTQKHRGLPGCWR